MCKCTFQIRKIIVCMQVLYLATFPVLQSSIPGSGRSLEKGMATHSSIPAWRVPWTEEPGGLQSMGSHRVGYDWATNTFHFNIRMLLSHFAAQQWLEHAVKRKEKKTTRGNQETRGAIPGASYLPSGCERKRLRFSFKSHHPGPRFWSSVLGAHTCTTVPVFLESWLLLCAECLLFY